MPLSTEELFALDETRGTRRNRKLRRLGLAVGSMMVGLLLAEGVCRLFIQPPPSEQTYKTFAHEVSENYKIIYQPAPGRTVHNHGVTYSNNKAGFRDREFAIERPAGTTRIVFIGDSVVYGYALEIENTLPKQLEKLFLADGQKVEVLNLGVSGYETEQQVEFFKEIGLKYKPDIVLVGYTLNDSNYGSGELEFLHMVQAKMKDPSQGPSQKILEMLYTHSRLMTLLDLTFGIQAKIKELRVQKLPIRKYLRERNIRYQDPEDSPYRQLEKQIMADAEAIGTSMASMKFIMGTIGYWAGDLHRSHWNLTRRVFQDLNQLSQENGFKTVIAIFPMMQEMDRYPLGSLHAYLQKEFEQMRFPVIDMMDFGKDIFQRYGRPDVSTDGIHFTSFSSPMAARYLYDRVIRVEGLGLEKPETRDTLPPLRATFDSGLNPDVT